MTSELTALVHERHQWRVAGKVVVVTNGVFDLLHYGHLQYLQAARDLGDVLIVGLNSDASTRRNKGPTRPLVGQDERAALLLALRPVDRVVIFDQPTAEVLVATLAPDVYVKGGDYRLSDVGGPGKPLPEAAIVERGGGHVVLVPYLPGHSTTELIDVIVARYGGPAAQVAPHDG